MSRQFGVSHRPALGADTQGGAPIARGATREPFKHDQCPLCGESYGHRFSCVVIQKDYIDAATREPIWLAGLEADLMSEVSPSSSGLTAASLSPVNRSHPPGARNEDALFQLAGGPPPRSSRTPLANSRGESPELSIANERHRALEFGAMCLVFMVGAFPAAFVGAAIWVISLVIYYGGSDSPF